MSFPFSKSVKPITSIKLNSYPTLSPESATTKGSPSTPKGSPSTPKGSPQNAPMKSPLSPKRNENKMASKPASPSTISHNVVMVDIIDEQPNLSQLSVDDIMGAPIHIEDDDQSPHSPKRNENKMASKPASPSTISHNGSRSPQAHAQVLTVSGKFVMEDIIDEQPNLSQLSVDDVMETPLIIEDDDPDANDRYLSELNKKFEQQPLGQLELASVRSQGLKRKPTKDQDQNGSCMEKKRTKKTTSVANKSSPTEANNLVRSSSSVQDKPSMLKRTLRTRMMTMMVFELLFFSFSFSLQVFSQRSRHLNRSFRQRWNPRHLFKTSL